jgi:multiple antibiotic resistance protein
LLNERRLSAYPENPVPYELFDRFILFFIGLFVVVDPFATVPVILGLTRDDDAVAIERIARRACVFGAGILLFFAVFGTSVFRFLQIDLNAFRAAGGLLLLVTALGMLKSRQRSGPDEQLLDKDELSVVPFATPLLSGPGAITTVVVYATNRNDSQPQQLLVLALAIALVFAISYVVLRSALPIKRLLGRSGITVVQQMMGLLLAAISLQFIVQGLVPLVRSMWVS